MGKRIPPCLMILSAVTWSRYLRDSCLRSRLEFHWLHPDDHRLKVLPQYWISIGIHQMACTTRLQIIRERMLSGNLLWVLLAAANWHIQHLYHFVWLSLFAPCYVCFYFYSQISHCFFFRDQVPCSCFRSRISLSGSVAREWIHIHIYGTQTCWHFRMFRRLAYLWYGVYDSRSGSTLRAQRFASFRHGLDQKK